MKTIEERAKEYADAEYPKCGLYDSWADDGFDEGYNAAMNSKADRAFIAGANSERDELMRWNDPFIKDMTKDNVLVKYIAVGCPATPYYTIGRRDQSGWWYCENELATSQPRFEIIGWRPIRE